MRSTFSGRSFYFFPGDIVDVFGVASNPQVLQCKIQKGPTPCRCGPACAFPSWGGHSPTALKCSGPLQPSCSVLIRHGRGWVHSTRPVIFFLWWCFLVSVWNLWVSWDYKEQLGCEEKKHSETCWICVIARWVVCQEELFKSLKEDLKIILANLDQNFTFTMHIGFVWLKLWLKPFFNLKFNQVVSVFHFLSLTSSPSEQTSARCIIPPQPAYRNIPWNLRNPWGDVCSQIRRDFLSLSFYCVSHNNSSLHERLTVMLRANALRLVKVRSQEFAVGQIEFSHNTSLCHFIYVIRE